MVGFVAASGGLLWLAVARRGSLQVILKLRAVSSRSLSLGRDRSQPKTAMPSTTTVRARYQYVKRFVRLEDHWFVHLHDTKRDEWVSHE